MTYNSRFVIAIEYEYYVLDILQHMLPMLDIGHLWKIYSQVMPNRHHLNRFHKNISDRPIDEKEWIYLNSHSSSITFAKHDWNICDWLVNEMHWSTAAGVIEQSLSTGGTSGHLKNQTFMSTYWDEFILTLRSTFHWFPKSTGLDVIAPVVTNFKSSSWLLL